VRQDAQSCRPSRIPHPPWRRPEHCARRPVSESTRLAGDRRGIIEALRPFLSRATHPATHPPTHALSGDLDGHRVVSFITRVMTQVVNVDPPHRAVRRTRRRRRAARHARVDTSVRVCIRANALVSFPSTFAEKTSVKGVDLALEKRRRDQGTRLYPPYPDESGCDEVSAAPPTTTVPVMPG